MFVSLKRKMVLGATAVVMGAAGSALAASPALAYHIDYGSASGGAVPVGTSYTATGAGAFSLTNASGGAVSECSTSSLSGQTTAIGVGAISSALAVSSSTFGGCRIIATNQTVIVSSNSTWSIVPTGGGPGTFTLKVSNVSLIVTCGDNSETFTGTLSTGVTWNNGGTGTNIMFAHAGGLSETEHTGSGCGLPGPYYISETYPFTTINGAPVTTADDFWLVAN